MRKKSKTSRTQISSPPAHIKIQDRPPNYMYKEKQPITDDNSNEWLPGTIPHPDSWILITPQEDNAAFRHNAVLIKMANANKLDVSNHVFHNYTLGKIRTDEGLSTYTLHNEWAKGYLLALANQLVKIRGEQGNFFIVQVYAPTADAYEIKREEFYEELNNIIVWNKKYEDVLIVCGDFISKVGCVKEDNVVGSYGLG
ncbi:hypothetical protein CAPTEDRAFT_186166 [Capitella teleta]|uniref:Endonuclease/exonuclease/phosphatase domain-containing protein n=1 Tax=Capitella teleta TaxID=283909 RepID=R7UK13_CAPTE|nr:hypothetical protein CAPTEDRAFT_186166 [Capitella teleta]|eukprot:ELU03612.1 hypothetical protein CAPTEDRAFT_186166 [Capitella teleta]